MLLIRRLIGTIYILGILILAITVLYYLFAGILPSMFKDTVNPLIAFLDNASAIISKPIAIVVDFILKFLPFLGGIFPVTNTGIIGAQIHWVPLLSLFIYTGILKAIDEFFLRNNVNKIEKNYNNDKN